MGAVRREGELEDIRRVESRFLQLLNSFSDFHHLFPLFTTMGDEEAPVEEYKLSDSLVADFKDAFERIDKEGTGEIPTSELGAVMRMLGHQLKPDQLQECIEEVDGDGSGFVDFDEFLVLMTKKTKEAEEEKEVREAFRILDKEGKGTIDAC